LALTNLVLSHPEQREERVGVVQRLGAESFTNIRQLDLVSYANKNATNKDTPANVNTVSEHTLRTLLQIGETVTVENWLLRQKIRNDHLAHICEDDAQRRCHAAYQKRTHRH